MEDSQRFLQLMQEVAYEGGKIACSTISKNEASLKPDRSVITETDLAISKLTHEKLDELLKSDDHVLIDEEDKNNLEYCDQEFLKSKKYIWSIDPIDGTRAYANKMPNFGISIGVMKDLKPWLGIVYLPLLEQLFYADGKDAFFIERIDLTHDLAHQDAQKIVPLDQEVTSQSIFMGTDKFVKTFKWQSDNCHLMNPSAAIICLCWPSVGKGCGSYFDAHIWDLAGSWSVFKAAGLDIRSVSSGEPLDYLDVSKFDAKTWKLKEGHILSSKRNYDILKANFSC